MIADTQIQTVSDTNSQGKHQGRRCTSGGTFQGGQTSALDPEGRRENGKTIRNRIVMFDNLTSHPLISVYIPKI